MLKFIVFFARIFIILLFFSVSRDIFAQKNKLPDSLRLVLLKMPADTSRIHILSTLAEHFEKKNTDSCLFYAQKIHEISEKFKNQRGIILSEYYTARILYIKGDNARSKEILTKCLLFFQKNNDLKFISHTCNILGNICHYQGDYDNALKYYLTALKCDEKLNNQLRISVLYNNIGNIHKIQRDFDAALHYYQKSLDLKAVVDDRHGEAICLNNIGNIYTEEKKFDKAHEYYQKSLKIKEELNDVKGIAATYHNLGSIYTEQKRYDSAVIVYEKSLKLREENGYKPGIVSSMRGLAGVLLRKNEIEKSIEVGEKCLKIAQEHKFMHEIGLLSENLYEAYKIKNDYQKALFYYENSKVILDSVFNLEKSKTITTLESKMQLEKKEKELALLAKDNELNKISSEKRAKELEIAKKQAEAEQLLHLARQEKDKRKADSLKNLAEKSRLEAEKLSAQKQVQEKDFQNEIFRQKRLQNTYLLIVFAVILLLIFIAYVLKQKQAANRILAQKNNEILQQKEELLVLTATLEAQKETVTSTYQKLKSTSDILEKSIRYASHIQSVVLPEEKEMRGYFSDLFIIFRPRDVVSGDFYWFSKISEDKAVFALADCTGHGVPGAFMSMLGATLLHETVNIKKVQDDAGRILRNVNSGLRKILKQELKKNNDGMEIAVCIFQKNTDKNCISVVFAGAKSQIACVNAGVFFEIKGDKKELGGDGKSIEFQNHAFNMPFNTVFYFYTDGFRDQNNPRKERLGSTFLKEILTNIAAQEMPSQKASLEKHFDDFRCGAEQRDDVSMVGLMLKNE